MTDLAKLEEIAKAATPGPWMLATSNSWRRFVTKFDTRSVCEPVTYSERDRHPDLHFPNGGADGPDAAYIATFSPDVALAILAVCKAADDWLNAAGALQMKVRLEALQAAVKALEELKA